MAKFFLSGASPASLITSGSAMPSSTQGQASEIRYTLNTTVSAPYTTNHKYRNMVLPFSSFLPHPSQSLLLVVLLSIAIVAQSYPYLTLSRDFLLPLRFSIVSMRVPPSTPPLLPASCFAGNPVSPLSADGQPEEEEAIPSSQPGEPEIETSALHRGVMTPRRRRSPTPVELQGTRLRTNTTPTHRGGQSSVRIHQLRRDREASARPSGSAAASSGHIPTTPTRQEGQSSVHIHQLHREREASAQPSGSAASSNTAGHISSTVVNPPSPCDQSSLTAAPSKTTGHIPSGIVIHPPPVPSTLAPPPNDQQGALYPQQFYAQYQGPSFLPQRYPHLPGAGIYPQQLYIPQQWASSELRATSPFVPPDPNRYDSTALPSGTSNKSHSHPCESRATSPFVPPSPNRHDSAPLAGSTATARPVEIGSSTAQDDTPDGLPDLIPVADLHKPKPDDSRNVVNPLELETEAGHDVINPFIDLSPRDDGSPAASADASKPKFKVGRRSKEDQEDWDKFVEECDLMYLDYAKKKNMPMEQVFAQYSALKRRHNSDSQWNFYQKLWAANLKQEMDRARKHIAYLISKGTVVGNVEEMSAQSLCSYGYAAYKQEYDDDWKERLELYNDLELASGEPMDYRTRTKAWNKFIDKLKRLCGAAYNSYEFNIAWVAVGSAILNDQGLQESGETEGVKGVWEIKYRCPNGYEKIHIKAHSHQLLSTKLLKAEWGDDDPIANTEAGTSSNITQGSSMNVESKRGADPTLFGMDAEDFNKLTDINKLRKCWTYSTTVVDPTWNEGHQLLWKGRLAKYAFRGIRVQSYPRGCLVPGQNLLAVSKGIADTPGDQVKILLSAFGVPGHAAIENPITFEIVDSETRDRMVANTIPVLIEVPPLPGSPTTRARQHYADGHFDDEGPSRTDLAKRLVKRTVTFSTVKALAVPPPHTSMSTTDRTELASPTNPPTAIPPLDRGEKKRPVVRPKIYMQSHNATAGDDTIIISSSSDTSPTPLPKSRKRPLSVDEEPHLQQQHNDDKNGEKEEAGQNIFQRGKTLRRGRGTTFTAAPSRSEKPRAQSKKPKAESNKQKYKSNEFIFDSPSPPPSPPATSKSATRPRPRPHRPPLNDPPSPIPGYKQPCIKLPSDTRTKSSPAPPTRHTPDEPAANNVSSPEPRQTSTDPVARSSVDALAHMMQSPRPRLLTPPRDQQQQRPSSQVPTEQASQPSNAVYYDSIHHPHNPGYVGTHAAPSFPARMFNQPAAYHPQQTAYQPLQEGGGMPRNDGPPPPMGGHHMPMGGGGGHIHMQMPVGGVPVQWPGGGMYYAPSMAYAGSGYGYPPLMAQQQQQPAQLDPLYSTHRPAGDYARSAPEREHHQG